MTLFMTLWNLIHPPRPYGRHLTWEERAAAFGVRTTFLPSIFEMLQSRYFWWKIAFSLRCTVIGMMPMAILLAANRTKHIFASDYLGITIAVLGVQRTLGAATMAAIELVRCCLIIVPLMTIYSKIGVYKNGYCWAAVYVSTLIAIGFFFDNFGKKLMLVYTHAVMLAMNLAYWDHLGPGDSLLFPLHLTGDFGIAICCIILAGVLPYPWLARTRSDRKITAIAEQLSLCVHGLCDSFWAPSNLQRKLRLQYVRTAQLIATNHVADMQEVYGQCAFELQRFESFHLRNAKVAVLSALFPLVDSTVRVLETIAEDPFILHGSAQSLDFERVLGPVLRELAHSVEAAVTLVARAKTIAELRFADPSDPNAESEAALVKRERRRRRRRDKTRRQQQREQRLAGQQRQKEEESPAPSTQSGKHATPPGHPHHHNPARAADEALAAEEAAGVLPHPLVRVLASLKDLESAYERARRTAYYRHRRALLVHSAQSPATPQQSGGRAKDGGEDDAQADAAFHHGTTLLAAMRAERRRTERLSRRSAEDEADGDVRRVRKPMKVAGEQSPSAAICDFTAEEQEFAALISFYTFTLTLVGRKVLEAPGIATTLRNDANFLEAVKEEMFMFGYRPYMFLKALLSYVRPSAAFFSNITPEARAASAMRLRESTKFAAAMGLANLFNYYTDRPFAFIYGPLSLCFISSLSSSEAMYGAFGRLFGTLTGAIVGLFFVHYNHTIVQDVAILCTVNFVFSFFRTGRLYGNAAAYASVQLIPMIADKYNDIAAVARITQITFGLLIYTFIAVMVLPTQPMVELTNARVAVLVKMAKTIQGITAAFAAPFSFPNSDRHDSPFVAEQSVASEGSRGSHAAVRFGESGADVPTEVVAARGDDSSTSESDSGDDSSDSSDESNGSPNSATSPWTDASPIANTSTSTNTTTHGASSANEEIGLQCRRRGSHHQQLLTVVKDDVGHPALLYTSGGDGDGGGEYGSGSDAESIDSANLPPPPVPDTWTISEPPMENGDFIPRVHKPREKSSHKKSSDRSEGAHRDTRTTDAKSDEGSDTEDKDANAEALIASAAQTLKLFEGLMAQAASWMPLAAMEPVVTRLIFPAAQSQEYHAVMVRMRGLITVMFEALRTLRLRVSCEDAYEEGDDDGATASPGSATKPSPGSPNKKQKAPQPPCRYFIAVLEDLAPFAETCGRHFGDVVVMIAGILSEATTGSAETATGTHRSLEGFVHKHTHYDTIRRALSCVEDVEGDGGRGTKAEPKRIDNAPDDAHGPAGRDTKEGSSGCCGKKKENNNAAAAEKIPRRVLMAKASVLSAQRIVRGSLLFEQACLELHLQKTAAMQQLVRVARIVHHAEVQERRRGASNGQSLANESSHSPFGTAATPAPNVTSNHEPFAESEDKYATRHHSSGNEHHGSSFETQNDFDRSALEAELAANGGRFPRPVAQWGPAELHTIADLCMAHEDNIALEKSSEQCLKEGEPVSGEDDEAAQRRQRVRMLISNADAEGLHTFSFCLVLFSKELKKLLMAAEAMRQHNNTIYN